MLYKSMALLSCCPLDSLAVKTLTPNLNGAVAPELRRTWTHTPVRLEVAHARHLGQNTHTLGHTNPWKDLS